MFGEIEQSGFRMFSYANGSSWGRINATCICVRVTKLYFVKAERTTRMMNVVDVNARQDPARMLKNRTNLSK